MICKSHKNTPIHGGRIVIVITVTIFLLLLTCFWAINTGSIEITMEELFRGLLISYDKKVASIYDLRFPRIIIACIAGAALSVSGVLLQNVLKNPLTDPGIIGISSGASFAALLFSMLLPALYQWMPLASFLGGIVAFLLVYSLSYQRSLSSIRIILVGVTISTMFSGFIQALTAMSGNNQSSVAMIVT